MSAADPSSGQKSLSLRRRIWNFLFSSPEEPPIDGTEPPVHSEGNDRSRKPRVRRLFLLLGVASAAFALGAFVLTLLPIDPSNFRVCSETRTVVEDESDETPDVTTERACQPISVSTGAPLAALVVALALATPLLLGLVPPGGEIKGPGGLSYKRALETAVSSEDQLWESTE